MLYLLKALRTAMAVVFLMSLATFLILGDPMFLIPTVLTAFGWVLLTTHRPED